MSEEQLVLFRLGNEEYAVSIFQVKEIIKYQTLTQLPGSSAYMEGIINLRGKIIPVVDLAVRLALQGSLEADKKIVILETEGREVGIIVDEVTEVLHIQDSEVELPITTARNKYIRGIGKAGNRLLILLDIDQLFAQADLEELKEVG